LSWEVTITSGDTEEERIVALEGLGINDWNVGLGRSVHLEDPSIPTRVYIGKRKCYLGQDFLRESLRDLEEIGLNTRLLKTFLLSLSKLLNVSTESPDVSIFLMEHVHIERI
jgi:hypothetical protein